MALINQKTGYSGFTLDKIGGSTTDEHGRVKKCIFSIVYPIRNLEVDFKISNGNDDWGAQMGDGTIIPLTNPVVLFANRDNSIIEFDMTVAYPANSPCVLVYRSDTAKFSIKDSDKVTPFVPNSVTGHFAFTVEGYGGTPGENGNVNRLLATIPFPIQSTNVNFTLTSDPSHWGARMGDGSIINLRNPQVLFTNRDNAIVQFSMDTFYPSNSPCVLVYRSIDAKYHLEIRDEDDEFIPVTDITDVPTEIAAGVYVDLSVAEVKPYNASIQGITWSIVNGSATVDGDRFFATKDGTITLKATIPGALDEGKKDYTKTFTIKAGKNTIKISAQPAAEMSLIVNEINTKLSVVATSTTGNLTYKWYHNTTASTSGATLIAGATNSSYTIPPSTNIGVHYYYCVLSSLGASTVTTIFSKVSVYAKLTGIKISPRLTSLGLSKKDKLTATQLPANAAVPEITWSSNNVEVIQVDTSGNIFAVGAGSARITAKAAGTNFTDFIDISVAAHVPVTFIDKIITKIDTDTEYVLSGTVVPANSTNKDIKWSIISAGETGAKLVDNKLSATKVGTVIIRATIVNGAGLTTNYIQDIQITVLQKFIPVTDVTFSGIPAKPRAEQEFTVNAVVTPGNATHRLVNIDVKDPGTAEVTFANNRLFAKKEGMCVIRATVPGGKSESEAFVKDITITFLPKWVAVESITGLPSMYEHVDQPLPLAGTVYPTNASMKQITYTLESPSGAKATMDKNNVLHIDYENVVWWIKNPNATPPNYYDQWLEGVTDPIVITARVKDGVKEGEDFLMKFNVGIQLPESPNIHIPIEHVALELPSILRSHRPILMSKINKTPWNATNGDIMMDFVRADTDAPGFGVSFRPSDETPEYWASEYGVKMDSEYSWTEDGYYMYSMEDIKAKLNFSVLNGNEDGTMYTQTDILQFLPEYIPVKNISNIPTSIPYNAKIYLSPDIDTRFPIANDSTEVYDVEIPSYSEINWTVISAGNTGAKFSNGILSFTRSGSCTIQAEIPQGTHEAYTWYDRKFNAVSYTQRFTIQVTGAESNTSKPIVTLKLNNGSTVKAYKVWDFYNLCNTLPADTSLTINGTTFRKDQVTEVEFWDMVPTFQGSDTTIPITDINLSKNQIGTNPKPSEGKLERFDSVYPDTDVKFKEGFVDFIAPGNPPFNVYTKQLTTNVFLKPDGTLVHLYADTGSLANQKLIDRIANATVSPTTAIVSVRNVANRNSSFGEFTLGYQGTLDAGSENYEGYTFVRWEITDGDPDSIAIDDSTADKTTFSIKKLGREVVITAVWIPNVGEYPIKEYVINKDSDIDIPFLVDPTTIYFPEGINITRYDNGYIGIYMDDRDVFLSDEGSLYISENKDVLTLNYTIDKYGVLVDNKDESGNCAYFPKGSKIRSKSIVINDRYVYKDDGDTTTGYDESLVTDMGANAGNTGIEFPVGTRLVNGYKLSFFDNAWYVDINDVYANSADGAAGFHGKGVIGNSIPTLTTDGWYLFNDKLYDLDGNLYSNKISLDSTTVTISPSSSTKKFKDLTFTLTNNAVDGTNSDCSKLSKIPLITEVTSSGITMDGYKTYIVAGAKNESALLTVTAPSGQAWHGQDYVKKISVAIGDISSMGTTVTGINTNYAVKILFASYRSQFINLSASLVGVKVSSFNQSSIKWTISGKKGSNTLFSSSYWGGSETAYGATTTLRIMRNETAGTDLKVKVTAGNAETIILIKMISEYADQPAITSLHNFGCNFTNLTKIDRIPDLITGDDCLRNFLAGCVKFNQKIEIPEFVEGDRCLKNFLGGCSSFNQDITIPEDISGEECLSRFLAGCTSFNRPITIPAGVTGVGCLMRFLEKCKSFNQSITIPTNVSGKQCLDHFLYGCETFNRPITIPDSVSGVAALRGFMRDTMKMTSPITISEIAAETIAANGLTLACFKRDVAYDTGVPIVGTGAEIFKAKFVNMMTTIPLRHLL